jgi:hypothetical protein
VHAMMKPTALFAQKNDCCWSILYLSLKQPSFFGFRTADCKHFEFSPRHLLPGCSSWHKTKCHFWLHHVVLCQHCVCIDGNKQTKTFALSTKKRFATLTDLDSLRRASSLSSGCSRVDEAGVAWHPEVRGRKWARPLSDNWAGPLPRRRNRTGTGSYGRNSIRVTNGF